jgi:Uma2 family endonuclease
MSTHLPDFEGTSIEQLAELSGSEGRCELVRGELRMMSPAGGRHGQVAMQCGRLLANHVETHGLGVVYAAETGFILARDPDTVRAPDVAYRSADDITVLRGTEELAADDVVPAWRVRVERLLG